MAWSETHKPAPLNTDAALTQAVDTDTVEERALRFISKFCSPGSGTKLVPSTRRSRCHAARFVTGVCMACLVVLHARMSLPHLFDFHPLPTPGAPRPRAAGSAAAVDNDGVTGIGVDVQCSYTGVDGGWRRRLRLERGRRQLAGRASAVARLLPVSLVMQRARWGGGGVRPEGATPPSEERGAIQKKGPHSPPPGVSARWTGAQSRAAPATADGRTRGWSVIRK